MGKWFRWIAYGFWALSCFVIFFYLLFPYEALGRRILHTLEQKTNLNIQSSRPEKRLLGIHWARVDIVASRESNLPPLVVKDWSLDVRPLALLLGQISLRSHATVMRGGIEASFTVDRRGQHGLGTWEGVRLERFPIPWLIGTTVSGLIEGRVRWERVDQKVDGEASFEVREGHIEVGSFGGIAVPPLYLGRVTGEVVLQGERLELGRISAVGGDLRGKLTGRIVLKRPLPRSQISCRLEVEFSETLLDRYPFARGIMGGGKAPTGPLVLDIRGTLDAPRISLKK